MDSDDDSRISCYGEDNHAEDLHQQAIIDCVENGDDEDDDETDDDFAQDIFTACNYLPDNLQKEIQMQELMSHMQLNINANAFENKIEDDL